MNHEIFDMFALRWANTDFFWQHRFPFRISSMYFTVRSKQVFPLIVAQHPMTPTIRIKQPIAIITHGAVEKLIDDNWSKLTYLTFAKIPATTKATPIT